MLPHTHWGETPLRYRSVKIPETVSEISETVNFTFTVVRELCNSPLLYEKQTGSPSEKSAPVSNSGNVYHSYTADVAGVPERAMSISAPNPLKSAANRSARWLS